MATPTKKAMILLHFLNNSLFHEQLQLVSQGVKKALVTINKCWREFVPQNGTISNFAITTHHPLIKLYSSSPKLYISPSSDCWTFSSSWIEDVTLVLCEWSKINEKLYNSTTALRVEHGINICYTDSTCHAILNATFGITLKASW